VALSQNVRIASPSILQPASAALHTSTHRRKPGCFIALNASILSDPHTYPFPTAHHPHFVSGTFLFDFHLAFATANLYPPGMYQQGLHEAPAEKAGLRLPRVLKKQSPHANAFVLVPR
jgi:hypothetical protein